MAEKPGNYFPQAGNVSISRGETLTEIVGGLLITIAGLARTDLNGGFLTPRCGTGILVWRLGIKKTHDLLPALGLAGGIGGNVGSFFCRAFGYWITPVLPGYLVRSEVRFFLAPRVTDRK